MERSWIGPTLLALLGASELGCATPCQNARARIEARYTECSIEIVGQPPPGDEACSDSDGRYQKCLADCTDSATCEALTGQDDDGAADLDECYADCTG